MKKIYILPVFAILAIAALNTVYFISNYRQQLAFHQSIMEKQVERTQAELLSNAVDFENEANYLIAPQDVEELFTEQTRAVELMRRFGLFFSKYHHMLQALHVYDTHDNAFTLGKDSITYFQPKFYKAPNKLKPEEFFDVSYRNGHVLYNMPLRVRDSLVGKLELQLALDNYLAGVLENYRYARFVHHWVIDDKGTIIFSDNNCCNSPELAVSFVTRLVNDTVQTRSHHVVRQGQRQKFLSAFMPVDLLNKQLLLIFSVPVSQLTESIWQRTLIASFLTLLILAILSAAFVYYFRNLRDKNKALSDANQRFHSVINALDLMVYVTTPQSGKVIFTNQAIDRCPHFDALRAQQPPPGKANKVVNQLENRYYEHQNTRIPWIDGQEKDLHSVVDVSERKHNEEKIAQSEQNLQQIFQMLPVAVFVVSEYDEILLLNDRASVLFEINDKEDALGHKITTVLKLSPYLQGEDSFENKDKFVFRKDYTQDIIVRRKQIPVLFNGEQATLETFTDITSIEAERRGETLANQAKTEFIANISHEIRNPLNAVTGMADTLLGSQLPEKEREYAEIIKKSADFLLAIINDMLDLSKIESGKLQMEEIPFQLRDEVVLTVKPYELQAQDKNIELTIDFADKLPNRFVGDPFRLKQILANLLSNAVKFTQEGEIRVSVNSVREQMGTHILLFSVQDSGIGIPRNKLNKIFESFTQADTSTTRKYGGTGLGTTIAKNLVEMMGGEIWVESPSELAISDAAPGTQFNFTVELFNDEHIYKSFQNKDIQSIDQLNVLVVDSQAQTNPLYNEFRHLGAQVITASDKEAAAQVLKDNYILTSRVQLVFIEDRTDFDGLEVMRFINEEGLSDWCVYVILTANNQPGNYMKSKKLNADYYIIKPYQTQEITAIIERNFPRLQLQHFTITEQKMPTNFRLLVAEDNRVNQRVILTLFKSLGYEPEMASNGSEVLNKWQNNDYDIIFLDILMPIKDGLQTTRELRKEGFKKPIIAVTGRISEKEIEEAKKSGMDDYLSKPVKLSHLKNILMKWLPG